MPPEALGRWRSAQPEIHYPTSGNSAACRILRRAPRSVAPLLRNPKTLDPIGGLGWLREPP
jgi:hypothetical protein